MTPEIEKRIKAVQAGRIPAGYKKTKVGIVPKEWDVQSFGEISFKTGRKKKKEEDYPVYSINNQKGFCSQAEQFENDGYANTSKDSYTLVEKDTFAYNPARINIGSIGLLKEPDRVIISSLYVCFGLNKNCNLSFFESYFKSHRFNYDVSNYTEGSVRQYLFYDNFSKINVAIPPLSEQKKIAEILATQDRVIELKEKLIAEKQSQKKYLMSVLLGDDFKKPFKLNGVTIDKKKWEKKEIGDICDTFSGGTPSRSHPEYFNGNIPWIKSGELNQENIYETEEFLTKKGIESSSAKMVKKGTLLIAMYGATAGVLAVSHIDAAINQAILALIPNIDINPFYLKSAIANQIDVAVHRLVQGGQPNFNASIINAFELRLPSLPEQKAIADVLSAADEEISLLQKDLEQEKLKKKSLMQLLLTGLVRVKV